MRAQTMRSGAVAVLLLVWSLTALPLRGATEQQTPPAQADQQPVFGTRTSAVLLDVVVRDRTGRIVRDLEASEVEVFEDGIKQEITSFTVFDRGLSGLSPAGSGAAPRPEAPVAAGPASDPRPGESQPSVIAFVFDRMSPEGKRLARKSALSYTQHAYADGDVVGVFAIDLALQTVQPFTTSLAQIRQGIDRAATQPSTQFASDRPRAGDREDFAYWVEQTLQGLGSGAQVNPQQLQMQAALLANERQFALLESRMLRAFDALERDQQGFATTNGLLALIEGLKLIPGRKTVVFLSEGVSIPASVLAQFRSVISTANRTNVTIYAMDAGGLRAESVTDEARKELMQTARRRAAQEEGRSDPIREGSMTRQLEQAEDMLRLNPHSGLGQLADETGGFLIRDTNDASAGFRRIDEDMRFHYVLSYTPTNESYDGAFRRIAVRVARPGLQAQTRSGYYAVRPDFVVPVRAYEAPALVQLDRSPRPDAFPMRAAGLSFPEATRPGLAPILVEIPGPAITFLPIENTTTHGADFTVVVQIRDERGREVDRLSQHYRLTVPAANLDAAQRGDVLFYRETQLPPGRYTAAAVAYDSLSAKASVRTTPLEIPPGEQDRLRLSSLFVLKRMEKLPPEEQKGRSPLIYGEAMVYPNMGEPLRKSAGAELGFFFTVYGGTSPAKATLELSQAGRRLGEIAVDLPRRDASGRIQYAGSLPLQAFAPGAYALKVTVTEGAISASRTTEFRVVE